MKTPFYTVCKADPAVQAALGGAEPRIFPFGEAPMDGPKPYVVYQWIGGNPFNCLSGRPEADRATLQVDVYATSSTSSSDIADLIRNAVELDSYITSYRGTMRDEETKLYRSSFDLDWLVDR